METEQMLKTEVSRTENMALLRCTGRIVAGKEAEALERIALEQDAPRLVLDLSSITSIDARGLGVLSSICRQARKEKVDFVLLNPSAAVLRLMSLMKLDTAIPVVRGNLQAAAGRSSEELHLQKLYAECAS